MKHVPVQTSAVPGRAAPEPTALAAETPTLSPRPPRGHEIASLAPSAASQDGHRLPPELSRRIEGVFGTRLGDVRVHRDAEAHRLNRRYRSQAFAQGQDIHFARGIYDPETPRGQRIIAHELAHIVQQRAGRVPAPDSERNPVNDDHRLEHEAEGMAEGALSHRPQRLSGDNSPGTERPEAFGGPVHAVQLWGGGKDQEEKKERKKEQEKEKARSILSPRKGQLTRATTQRLGDNSNNEVYKQERLTSRGFFKRETEKGTFYLSPSEKGGERSLYYENEELRTGNARKASRAVASSRVDRAIGTNVLSEDEFVPSGLRPGGSGTWVQSREVLGGRGVPLQSQYGRGGGARVVLNRHDLSNPRTQRGLADLQLLDAITGQTDRHGGNILIDPETGEVRGIDNDVSMGSGYVAAYDERTHPSKIEIKQERARAAASPDVPREHFPGLPSLVDRRTADRVTNFDPSHLRWLLRGERDDPERLSDEQIERAVARLRVVREHVGNLRDRGALVDEWNDETHRQALSEPDWSRDQAPMASTPQRSYLKRHHFLFDASPHVEDIEGARPGEYRQSDAPMLPALPRLSGPRPSVAHRRHQRSPSMELWQAGLDRRRQEEASSSSSNAPSAPRRPPSGSRPAPPARSFKNASPAPSSAGSRPGLRRSSSGMLAPATGPRQVPANRAPSPPRQESPTIPRRSPPAAVPRTPASTPPRRALRPLPPGEKTPGKDVADERKREQEK